ncbi:MULTISPECIES: hypothetical protein [unclassified Janthinobacterium]|uniref:hypothetical protein n=1 Tax=unclassified Janthinobacterium TaxID=2610881 RepID=UPI0016150818|nr:MULTISPECIES: hypothetical protein [unclassified Janthinobacterium]MBB5610401.1 hypothetical protein [Janthinobacterium sp. S3T4]MBB5615762.1 hypothetical protein [Janthinobacterium sp. S3M3]
MTGATHSEEGSAPAQDGQGASAQHDDQAERMQQIDFGHVRARKHYEAMLKELLAGQ